MRRVAAASDLFCNTYLIELDDDDEDERGRDAAPGMRTLTDDDDGIRLIFHQTKGILQGLPPRYARTLNGAVCRIVGVLMHGDGSARPVGVHGAPRRTGVHDDAAAAG